MSKSHKVKSSHVHPHKSSTKKKLGNFLRLLVSCIAIGLLIWMFRDKLHGVGRYLRKTDIPLLLAAFISYVITTYVMSYRLQLFSDVHKLNLNVNNCFYLNTIAHFFNNFLPSSMGGDVVKVYYAAKKTKKKVGSFVAILMDRFCGLITFIFFAMVALMVYGNKIGNDYMYKGTIAACIMTVLALVFMFNKTIASKFKFLIHLLPKKVQALIKDIYYGFHEFKNKKFSLFLALIVSLIAQSGIVLCNFLIGKSLGLSIHFAVFFLVIPLVNCVSVFAPSINGLGVREGAYVYFLSRFAPAEGALALSILWYAILLAMSLLGGSWFALKGQLNVSEITQAVESEDMEDLLELDPSKK